MKADLTEQTDADAAATATETNGTVADPFAVDLFATKREPSATADADAAQVEGATQEPLTASPEAIPWNARLPQVTALQARFSSAISALPPPLSAQALAVLERFSTHYLHTANDAALISMVKLREAELSAVALGADAAPRLFLSLAIEPTDARLAFEMEAGFVAAIVDRVLGGEGAAQQSLRPLSQIEQTVAEFLFLSLLREFNRETGEPLLKLDALTNAAPSWLMKETKDAERADHEQAQDEMSGTTHNSRGLILTVRLRVAEVMGLARVYIPSDALAALDPARNPLLFDAQYNMLTAKLARYKKIVSSVPLSLLVGETSIPATALAQLERGDVVLIESPRVRWSNERVSGEVQVNAGDSRNIRLTGSTTQALPEREVSAQPESGTRAALKTIKVVIETISTTQTRTKVERLRMEEERDATQSAETLTVLDDLSLTVRVELAARRMSLDELVRLRAGQILDLGCVATDPVNLMVEEKLVARGELVDIEGRLGVRITQLAS